MKKTIQHFSLVLSFCLALLPAMLSGCSKESGELFDTSPSERQAKAIEDLINNLSSGDEGWIMEYIPSEQQDFGGYVLELNFDKNGEVFARAADFPVDKDGKPMWGRSKYDVNSQYGTVLDFSTYNEVLNYFADPDINDGYGQGDGFHGDVSFRVLESENPNDLTLQGRMTGNRVRLFRPEEGADAYFEKVVEMKDDALNLDYYFAEHLDAWTGTIGGKNVVLKYNEDGFYKFSAEIEGLLDPVDVPFVITTDGVRLLREVNGVTELKWNSGDKTWTTNGGDAPLALREDPVYPAYSKYLGTYLFLLYNYAIQKSEIKTVELEQGPRKTYEMEGFDYGLSLSYDAEKDLMLLHPQNITYSGSQYMFVGLNTDSYGFTMDERHGLEAIYDPESEYSEYGKVYNLVDNGLWGQPLDAFVLITSSYSIASGVPSYFIVPMFLIKLQ